MLYTSEAQITEAGRGQWHCNTATLAEQSVWRCTQCWGGVSCLSAVTWGFLGSAELSGSPNICPNEVLQCSLVSFFCCVRARVPSYLNSAMWTSPLFKFNQNVSIAQKPAAFVLLLNEIVGFHSGGSALQHLYAKCLSACSSLRRAFENASVESCRGFWSRELNALVFLGSMFYFPET